MDKFILKNCLYGLKVAPANAARPPEVLRD
jgi:hypothetical protein